jgi:hypothetical protein
MNPLSIQAIDMHVMLFVKFARSNPTLDFALTPIGCGLAGNNKRAIWGIIKSNVIPNNVYLTSTWVTE